MQPDHTHCIVCNTPIHGKRKHKRLCGNACTIKLHRQRKSLITQFRSFLFDLPNSHKLFELETLLLRLVENTNSKPSQKDKCISSN